MISRDNLLEMYEKKGISVAEIAVKLGCSQNKVNYWLKKNGIKKRSISEAIYKKHNPNGDPFQVRELSSVRDGILFGMGVGLYWGEGTKANKHSIRLGNSDPALIAKFIEFLVQMYGIDKAKLRFGLQIFGDMDSKSTMSHWIKYLGVSRSQFFPSIIVTPHRGVGNYRKKTKYGVLTLYFNNKKLRDILCNTIEECRWTSRDSSVGRARPW